MARKFLRWTFGTDKVGQEVVLDHDGSEHKALFNKLHTFVKDQREVEVDEKYNENFNYSRGTFEWGCQYCGELAYPCKCGPYTPITTTEYRDTQVSQAFHESEGVEPLRKA